MEKIKLGYQIGDAESIYIVPAHLVVTGVTQQSGKTTTLEALIKRSKLKAVVFRTKIGEKSFIEGTVIPPFFKDKSNWQFIQGLIESTIKEKLRTFERAKIIQICKRTSGNSLLEFKKEVDQRLLEKINQFEKDILTNVQAYLEIVLPKLQTMTFSNTLELTPGINIIDLERFSRDDEVQSLIIASVAEEILYNFKNVVVVLPEAWKFLPQKRGNPCKLAVVNFIRQGATNNNFIWIDSQDMANVDKDPLKQVSTWILGYQSEINEVKHTLDQIPLPQKQKPKPDEIMRLGIGEFILATRELTTKVYVQPSWLEDNKAVDIALGKLKVSEIDAPERIAPFRIALRKEELTQQQTIDFSETSKRFNKELNQLGADFFDKIADIQDQINKIYTEMYNLKHKPAPVLDEDTIIRKIMQKMPAPTIGPISASLGESSSAINKEAIISEILARIPKSAGTVVYEVVPLEKIRQDFLIEIKTKIITDVENISDQAKKVLKYIESHNTDITPSELITKCMLWKSGGSNSVKMSGLLKELLTAELTQKTAGGRYRANLKERIQTLMGTHEATKEEIDQVYNHILMEILKQKSEV